MNRIDKLFLNKRNSVLSVYFTAGYPELNDTNLIIEGLEKGGADLVEIGFPFSDPVADGPVIQASSHQALLNGMNLDVLFDKLKKIKDTSSIPKILMGYFNTVYQYTVGKFINQCVECGIDGVIIPDLPPEVYEKDYRVMFESAGVHFIFLVAPQTSPERTKYLASLSRGFIYQLSSSSTTGTSVRADLSVLPSSALGEMGEIPTLIGFGIHDHETFAMACNQANGAIIGTAFIRHLNAKLAFPDHATMKDVDKQLNINLLCEDFIRRIRG